MRAAFVAQLQCPAWRVRASRYNASHATAASSTETGYKRDLSDLMKVLETDSPNLFSEQGMHPQQLHCLIASPAACATPQRSIVA